MAAYEQLLNGSAFGLTTLLLLFGLDAILVSYGSIPRTFHPACGLITRVTSTMGPILVLSFQFSSSLDVEAYRSTTLGEAYQATGRWGLSGWVWANLSIELSAILVIGILARFGRHLPSGRGIQYWVGKGVLLYTVMIAVVCSFVLPLLPERALTAAWLGHGILALTAIAAVAISAMSRMNRMEIDAAVAGETEETSLKVPANSPLQGTWDSILASRPGQPSLSPSTRPTISDGMSFISIQPELIAIPFAS